MFRRKEPAEDDAIAVKRPIELDDETLEKFNTITEMCEEVYCGMRKGFLILSLGFAKEQWPPMLFVVYVEKLNLLNIVGV